MNEHTKIASVSDEERLDRREHVAPSIAPARVDALWQSLAAERAAPSSWRGAYVAVALAAACGLIGFFTAWFTSDNEDAVATVADREGEAARFELPDGSTVEPDADADLRLAERGTNEVRLVLDSGKARFQVTRNPERHFLVEAGDVLVRVIGTRFTVERTTRDEAYDVRVDVHEGIVEVEADGEVRRLHVGEHWQWSSAPTPVENESARVASSDDGHERRARGPRRSRVPPPAALLESAAAARRDGKPREAARHYEALLVRYPRDRRAGLAAFELGRIRMDSLSDSRGAEVALRRALNSGSAATFHEDALARLVRLYDSAGSADACAHTKDAYLSRYPRGRWTPDVNTRCAP